MFDLTHPLPSKCYVACSYGIDSMCALHWLNKVKGRVSGVLHINHGTGEFADEAHFLIANYCDRLGIEFISTKLDPPPKGRSKEDYWREERYKFFELCIAHTGTPIVLAHNLDDCVEEYIMNSVVRGRFGTISYDRNNGKIIRPFRTWKRTDINTYAARHLVPYLEDPSNKDKRYKRNYIRHELMPKLLELNPGLYSMVHRMILEEKI